MIVSRCGHACAAFQAYQTGKWGPWHTHSSQGQSIHKLDWNDWTIVVYVRTLLYVNADAPEGVTNKVMRQLNLPLSFLEDTKVETPWGVRVHRNTVDAFGRYNRFISVVELLSPSYE